MSDRKPALIEPPARCSAGLADVLVRRGRPRKRVDENGHLLVIAQALNLSVAAAQKVVLSLRAVLTADGSAGSPIAPLEDWQPVSEVAKRWRKSREAIYRAHRAGLLRTREVNGRLEVDALARPERLCAPGAFLFSEEAGKHE